MPNLSVIEDMNRDPCGSTLLMVLGTSMGKAVFMRDAQEAQLGCKAIEWGVCMYTYMYIYSYSYT